MGHIPDGAVFRFRSLDSLLGEFSELEKQSIYFSPPEQLNDPIEGARQITWRGDAITWTNLLRHYVICLYFQCLKYMVAGDDHDMGRDQIDVFRNMDTFSTPKDRSRFESCLVKVADLASYRELLALLSSANRVIAESELLTLLNIVHIEWLTTIHAEFYSAGLIATPLPPLPPTDVVVTSLRALKTLPQQLQEQGGEEALESLREFTVGMMEQNRLRVAYNNAGILSENRSSLFLEFPQLYLKNLLKLMFPPWYVACFTKRYDNPAMWSYYANNHNGCCLIFRPKMKINKLFLSLKGPNGFGSNGVLRGVSDRCLEDVVYSKDTYQLEFFQNIGQLTNNDLAKHWFQTPDGKTSPLLKHFHGKEWRDEYWQNFGPPLLNKLADWAHEAEMRIILSDSFQLHGTPEGRVFNYEFDILDGIIFGLNVSVTDKVKIMKIINDKLHSNNQTREFRLFQAYYNAQSGKIAANPMDFLGRWSES